MMDVSYVTGSVLPSEDAKRKDGAPAWTMISHKQINTKWCEKGFIGDLKKIYTVRNAQLSLKCQGRLQGGRAASRGRSGMREPQNRTRSWGRN